ncbi:MAG: DUF4177 domain-containing protein [Oscillospiraceae bacterium]|jgi:hypothetical protein|nr:DUF4177 domain-containing protein [Oscillospiraceae bacterium]
MNKRILALTLALFLILSVVGCTAVEIPPSIQADLPAGESHPATSSAADVPANENHSANPPAVNFPAVGLNPSGVSNNGADKWEYKWLSMYRSGFIDNVGNASEWNTDNLNLLGTEGWELVSVSSTGQNWDELNFFFKRRLP